MKLDWRGFILTGFGLAGVVYGFENLGRNALPFATVIGDAGRRRGLPGLSMAATRAARPHAILDLSVFRLPSFMTSTIGGTLLAHGHGRDARSCWRCCCRWASA